MSKLPFKNNCVIKEGVFPESAVGICDKFCFVNLDMDLYDPMLEGLRFFWNKMVPGGVVLLHDYFCQELPGVSRAVADFESSLREYIPKIPINDGLSIALVKGGSML